MSEYIFTFSYHSVNQSQLYM